MFLLAADIPLWRLILAQRGKVSCPKTWRRNGEEVWEPPPLAGLSADAHSSFSVFSALPLKQGGHWAPVKENWASCPLPFTVPLRNWTREATGGESLLSNTPASSAEFGTVAIGNTYQLVVRTSGGFHGPAWSWRKGIPYQYDPEESVPLTCVSPAWNENLTTRLAQMKDTAKDVGRLRRNRRIHSKAYRVSGEILP